MASASDRINAAVGGSMAADKSNSGASDPARSATKISQMNAVTANNNIDAHADADAVAATLPTHKDMDIDMDKDKDVDKDKDEDKDKDKDKMKEKQVQALPRDVTPGTKPTNTNINLGTGTPATTAASTVTPSEMNISGSSNDASIVVDATAAVDADANTVEDDKDTSNGGLLLVESSYFDWKPKFTLPIDIAKKSRHWPKSLSSAMVAKSVSNSSSTSAPASTSADLVADASAPKSASTSTSESASPLQYLIQTIQSNAISPKPSTTATNTNNNNSINNNNKAVSYINTKAVDQIIQDINTVLLDQMYTWSDFIYLNPLEQELIWLTELSIVNLRLKQRLNRFHPIHKNASLSEQQSRHKFEYIRSHMSTSLEHFLAKEGCSVNNSNSNSNCNGAAGRRTSAKIQTPQQLIRTYLRVINPGVKVEFLSSRKVAKREIAGMLNKLRILLEKDFDMCLGTNVNGDGIANGDRIDNAIGKSLGKAKETKERHISSYTVPVGTGGSSRWMRFRFDRLEQSQTLYHQPQSQNLGDGQHKGQGQSESQGQPQTQSQGRRQGQEEIKRGDVVYVLDKGHADIVNGSGGEIGNQTRIQCYRGQVLGKRMPRDPAGIAACGNDQVAVYSLFMDNCVIERVFEDSILTKVQMDNIAKDAIVSLPS